MNFYRSAVSGATEETPKETPTANSDINKVLKVGAKIEAH